MSRLPGARPGRQFIFDASFTASVTELKKPIAQKKPFLLFMKMIQTVKQVMHHNKELDITKMILVVKNTSQDKLCQKKLFFNREMLNIGYVPIAFGDNVVLTFHTKSDDDQLVSFSSFEFRVETTGLVQVNNGYSTQ
jgi:hypothetical protein